MSQLSIVFDEILTAKPRITYQEWASIGYRNGWLGTRNTDPETSRQATVNLTVRAGSQRHRLLHAYATAVWGLTDEEAGNATGLTDMPRCCYWKRCSELRQAGYIQPAGRTRASTAGEQQQVCEITEAGRRALCE
jgi:hypothetical protein